ncbi:MAG: proline dehydrogenase family protein [Gemmatimonadaceae bacterium]|nr:proline dehydrogenase family protein [Gemmatimonadaceae bacterium]
MSIGRTILLKLADSEFLNRQATQRAFVKRATRRFMPGEAPEDALHAARMLKAEGRGTVFTKLGEAITARADAEAVRDHYLWFFDQLAASGLDGHVSVKPTQLGLDLSYDECLAHLMVLAARSESIGKVFWIDMEGFAYVDPTLKLYRALKERHPNVGLAMQAYLYRTQADLDALMPLHPIIRLVKGAYAEPASVAFPLKADTNRNYFALADQMLKGAAAGECTPILGTHDIPLLDRLVAQAKQHGTPDRGYEIHMLYGIRDADQRRLRSDGRTVKTLISYGSAWYKWYMRRLAERPANVWFVVKSMVG